MSACREKHAEFTSALSETEAQHAAGVKEHEAISKELERANKDFKEFERKDIKAREDLKHAKVRRGCRGCRHSVLCFPLHLQARI